MVIVGTQTQLLGSVFTSLESSIIARFGGECQGRAFLAHHVTIFRDFPEIVTYFIFHAVVRDRLSNPPLQTIISWQ